MGCDNCESDAVAYTLTTHVESASEESIDLDFCSSECLRVWT